MNKPHAHKGNYNSNTDRNNQHTCLIVTHHDGGHDGSQSYHFAKLQVICDNLNFMICCQGPFKGHEVYEQCYSEENKIKNRTHFWLMIR